jgi:hypothetical protein
MTPIVCYSALLLLCDRFVSRSSPNYWHFDFQASSSGGIPNLKEDWRWDDQEEAVLSTCSSLIAIVRNGDSRVVQFSHFSVKEYLTSPRLARSHGDVSRFYIDLEPRIRSWRRRAWGHCSGWTNTLEMEMAKGFPLVEYAAEHWVEHARFEKVSSRVRDGMDDLFDTSKPHFAAWLRVHDIGRRLAFFFSPWDATMVPPSTMLRFVDSMT